MRRNVLKFSRFIRESEGMDDLEFEDGALGISNDAPDYKTNHSNQRSKLKKVSLDLGNEGPGGILQLLQEIIEEFNLQIINMHPIGPAGGNPEVTFRGEDRDIMKLLQWYCGLTGGEDPYEWYDEFVTDDGPIPFRVQTDDRFLTSRNRQHIEQGQR